MLDSPVITLLAALCGLGLALAVVSALLQPQWPARNRWAVAASVVAVVVLGVALPTKLQGSLNSLNAQRHVYAGTYERQAHERCLNDMGRPDLIGPLAAARKRIGEDGRYYARTTARSIACLIFNMFPSAPVAAPDLARDWILLDSVQPEQLEPGLREVAQRRGIQLRKSPSFILVPPERAAQ